VRIRAYPPENTTISDASFEMYKEFLGFSEEELKGKKCLILVEG